jgi:C4-dicarboxylate transporter/malic acid transport protein
MTSTASVQQISASTSAAATSGGRVLLRDLESPRQALANITPNWYASVMGTGIVAVAAASLPLQFDGLRPFATMVWALAAVLLIGLTVATAAHWHRHPAVARGHLRHPVMGFFYGAPPMAMMTVGAGTLLLGSDVLGLPVALAVDWALWILGTVTGLIGAVVVPYLMLSRHRVTARSAFGGWLMPVVPPMVSASTGALLIPHLPDGDLRAAMLIACYAMFAASLIASAVVIAVICRRLFAGDVGPARMVPTWWIVLGPLGQSITAANLLGGVAHFALPASTASALHTFGIIYGITTLGIALLWAAMAGAITIRTAREGLPFSLTWWSFTFPIGTCVTGITALSVSTGSWELAAAAVLSYLCLVAAWTVVAVRTAHGSIRGYLFLP